MPENKMKYSELARFIAYMLTIVIGGFALILGILRGDVTLMGLGGALIGSNALASWNVTRTGGKYGA